MVDCYNLMVDYYGKSQVEAVESAQQEAAAEVNQPSRKPLSHWNFLLLFLRGGFVSSFYTFLVDCQYELLIDLCCLMPLWKAVFCIFFILFILYISSYAVWRCLNLISRSQYSPYCVAECPCIDVRTCWCLTLKNAPPYSLNARWVCGIAVADWCVGNRRTCSHGPVRSLLSGSDGLWWEESDHINVLAGQAASKPH